MRLIQSGPRTAKIVCVGEAPGANEDEKGKPFVGASGDDLNRYLADIGWRRASYDGRPDYDQQDDVFVTNVVHVRPPGNRFEAFVKPKPSPHLFMGILQLKKDLEEIKPNLVIAFGDVPMRYLTNKHGIGKYRGSILSSTLVPGMKVIPTFHPASVFRIYENKALIQLDMKRIKEEAASPELNLPERKIYIWGMHDLFDVDLPTIAAEMYQADWLSIDIESDPEKVPHELICVGFSDRPDRALVVPKGSPGGWELIKRLCASPAKKCGQNAGPYDKVVLEDNGIPVANFTWDIMYSHHALLMEAAGGGDEVKDMRGTKKTVSVLRKGLGFQVSIYTREPYYKDDGKAWRTKSIPDIKEFYRYCGKDSACTGEIRIVHDRELDVFGVRHVFEHEMKLLPMLTDMTRRGVKIDLAMKASLKTQYEGEIVNLNKFFEAQTGSVLNVKSPPQMQKLLYETLGLPIKYHRETKRPTANKDAILELAAKHEHPVLMAILEIRKRRDLIERYLDAGVDADGRMRCLFDPSGTRTGRLASRANIYGSGTNLQNIPPKLRRMFVADPGKVFFYVDLSQAEARVVAWLARCESLIELFTSGRDIHKENAVRFFGEYKEEKRISVKRIVHGSNYGEGIDRIVQVAAADGIKLSRHEVSIGQEAYFMLYPEIKENWWADVRRDLRYRLLTTPLGWKRHFYGRWDSNKFFNEGLAFQPQCTVGVLAEMGMMACQDVPDSEILLNAHDAVLGQCDEDKAAVVIPAIVKAMEIPLMIHGKQLIIPADAKFGRNWEEAADDNPEGLKKWAR